MKKSQSQLSTERLAAENAVLLLEVVDNLLRRIDPSTTPEPDPRRPLQIATVHVRSAMSLLTAALTGEEAPPPSGLFRYLARVFGEQFLACKKYEDELANSNPPDISVN